VGQVPEPLITALAPALAAELDVPCEILAARLDPSFALHAERGQYHSTEILARMRPLALPGTWRLLGVTEADLYIPILTFVFGEAQVGGACAIISARRFRQEFYGLAPDPDLFRARIVKESVHELGHTLGLSHCEDYLCAMAPSHAVEWIDLKGRSFCAECRESVAARREP
jgi:archaemetzincin